MTTLFLQSSLLQKAGFVHGFTMRQGGCSSGDFDSLNFGSGLGDSVENIECNFRILCEQLSFPWQSFHGVHQVHGTEVYEWDSKSPLLASQPQADAICTNLPQQGVFVKVADCVPILIAEKTSRWVAAVHAGWRGVAGKIVTQTIEKMRQKGSGDDFLFAIGPHIREDAFQVGKEVQAFFVECSKADPQEKGKYKVSLEKALHLELENCGFSKDCIDVLEGCTFSDPSNRFYSYRKSKGLCGRQIGFIIS